MFKSSGVKGIRMVLLITDSQIVNKEFLVYINAILTNGYTPGLFAKEDMDNIIASLNNDAKAGHVRGST